MEWWWTRRCCNAAALAERDAAMIMAERVEGVERITLAADKGVRHQRLREGDAGHECDSACFAEHQASGR